MTAYLHDAAETERFDAILDTAWISLTDLGLADGASLDRLRIVTDLTGAWKARSSFKKARRKTLALKQALYARLGRMVPPMW